MAFASAGIELVLAGRTLEKVEKTADMARERGVLALTLACNVRDVELDIGREMVALCREDLEYLTGATVPLDGGQANF